MKRIAILIVLFFCVNNLFARLSKKESEELYRHRAFISSLLNQNQTRAAMKTTTYRERVIAQCTRGNVSYFIPVDSLADSVNVTYTSSRHSVFDYNMMQYSYSYPYGNSPMFNYAGAFTKPQVLFDTMMHWALAPNLVTHVLSFGFYEKTFGDYDVNNNLTDYYDLYADSANNQNMSYINTFDVNGNITSGYWFNLTLGSPDSVYKQLFTYNGGKLSEDSIFIKRSGGWSIVAKTYYAYDLAGNLVQIDCYADSIAPLTEKLKYVNTYDGSNRLHTVLTSEYDGTSLIPYVKDTFDYSGSLNFHSAWREHRWDGVNHYWAPISNMTKHLNASLLPDTVYNQLFDSLSNAWAPKSKDVFTYDSFSNPAKFMEYTFSGSAYSTNPTNITTYYYEQYVTAGVEKIISQNDNTIIYPNPATDKIRMAQLTLPANSIVLVNIINSSGQLVRTMQTTWQNKTIEIPVGDLVPGLYGIYINDAGGRIIHNQKIIKQ